MGLRSILYESWTYSHADPSSVARFDHVAAFRPPLAGHDEAQPYANPGFRAMAGSHANYALPLARPFGRVRALVEPQFIDIPRGAVYSARSFVSMAAASGVRQ